MKASRRHFNVFRRNFWSIFSIQGDFSCSFVMCCCLAVPLLWVGVPGGLWSESTDEVPLNLTACWLKSLRLLETEPVSSPCSPTNCLGEGQRVTLCPSLQWNLRRWTLLGQRDPWRLLSRSKLSMSQPSLWAPSQCSSQLKVPPRWTSRAWLRWSLLSALSSLLPPACRCLVCRRLPPWWSSLKWPQRLLTDSNR